MVDVHGNLAETLGGFAVLLLALAALRVFSRHSRLPAESWILLVGLVYGELWSSFPALPLLEVSPDLVILLLLPVLVFASARSLPPRQLKSQLVPILFFATIGVVTTMALIGLPLYALTSLPLADALLFASAVAATDPSAVSAIFQRFTVPERLAVLIEGESLFNDGTAIVLFFSMATLAINMESLTVTSAAQMFAWTMVVAVVLGAVLGWCAAHLIRLWRVKNQFPGLSITLALVYGGFLLAERGLHVSGVVTVMFAAWVFMFVRGRGERPPAASDGAPTDSLQPPELFVGFWDYLNQLAGGILFFALGVTVGRHEFPFSWLIPGIILVLVLARVVVIYGGSALMRAGRVHLPAGWQHVLVLGGLRGAVSAALILMLPEDYVYREYLLCLALVLCLYTLVVHPFLLQAYLQRQRLPE
ncbi:cation:proton antiporter [Marinobacter sp. SS21]|uniref:cation:proton antiporter n=1 Tax=Marinobacter sp. SS21 TaxID=2979460 RepID=UPI00232D36BA|nr:cation:proton antiporter [Marinobacter sp. SS21]MDC0661483.1 cation:proton antiporter [Marinobacter sp. SS21]